MPTDDPTALLALRPGDRVTFKSGSAIKEGVVVTIDETVFPGVVVVKDDDGKTHDIEIGIGWPKQPPASRS